MPGSGVLLDTGKATITVDPGVCRLVSKVEVWMEDDVLKCHIESACKHVQEMAAKLDDMTMMDVIKMPYSENKVYQMAGRTLKHSTCVLPAAVLKAAEVATGLGLKRDVHLTFEK